MFLRQLPTVVDIMLCACTDDPRVLRYIHEQKRAWKHALQSYIVNTPASNDKYLCKVQWGMALYEIVQPCTDFEDVVANVAYNVRMMDNDTLRVSESERTEFMEDLIIQYQQMTRQVGKRACDASDERVTVRRRCE